MVHTLGGCVTSLVMTTSSSAHLSDACLRFTSCFMAVKKPYKTGQQEPHRVLSALMHPIPHADCKAPASCGSSTVPHRCV
jgi:hypothetical protein